MIPHFVLALLRNVMSNPSQISLLSGLPVLWWGFIYPALSISTCVQVPVQHPRVLSSSVCPAAWTAAFALVTTLNFSWQWFVLLTFSHWVSVSWNYLFSFAEPPHPHRAGLSWRFDRLCQTMFTKCLTLGSMSFASYLRVRHTGRFHKLL